MLSAVKIFFLCVFFLFNFFQVIAQKKKDIEDYISLYHSNEEHSFRDTIALRAYLDTLFRQEELKESKALVFYQIIHGKAALRLPDAAEAVAKQKFENAVKLVTSLDNPSLELWVKVNIGYSYYRYRKLSKALPYFMKADSLYLRLGEQDLLDKEDTFKKMGFFFGTLGKTDRAIHLLEKALKYTPDRSNEQAALLDNLAMYYLGKSDTLMANKHFERAKAIAIENHDYIRVGKVLGNMAIVLESKGQIEQAVAYLKQDIAYSRQYGDPQNTLHASLQLAGLYVDGDSILTAKKILDDLLPGVKGEENLVTFYKKALTLRLLVAEKEKDVQMELYLRRQLDNLMEKAMMWDGEEALKNSQWMMKQQDFVQEIQSNKAIIKKEKNTSKIYISIAVILSVIIIALYLFFKRENKLEKDQFEKKIRKLQAEHMASVQHQSVRQTRVADNFPLYDEATFNGTSNTISIKSDQYKNRETENTTTLWSVLLNGHLMTEENWQEFLSLYGKEYPEFLRLIYTDYPEIKGSGLRCVLLSKLGLTNKEAAGLLGVSPDTIKKTRQRLRYKMDEDKYKRLLKLVSSHPQSILLPSD